MAPPPEPGLDEEPVSTASSDEAQPRVREAGRGGQAEDFARPWRHRLGAEVRGGEKRGCSEGEAGSGVGVPHATRAAVLAGRGVPGGRHPLDPRRPMPARVCVRVRVGGLAVPSVFAGVPAPRWARGGTLEPAGPRP